MRKSISIMIVFAFLVNLGFAQTGGIKGVIKDNNGALSYSQIYVKGTQNGVISDFNGAFQLVNVPEGQQTIIIAFVGYQNMEQQVNVEANKTIDLGIITMAETATDLKEITITGSMAFSEAKAINIKKNSLNIVDAIAADGIGKLPDRNAAEAVQRVPGVSIERDQGEGRFVAVRGLPSQWSSTTLGGNRIPAAEEETNSRATAFDFFPTDLIQIVEVSKAITPDMEADAMGGNVNFVTRSSPDEKVLNITLGGGYNAKANKPIYSGSVLFGGRSKDNKWGFIANGSIWNRNWATDNYEPRRKDGGVYRLELRDYFGTRRTIGANVGGDFKPNENNKFYINGMYGTLNDHELHYKHRIRFDKAKVGSEEDGGRIELQNISNILITEMYGGVVGGEHGLNNVGKFDWNLAYYNNNFYYGNIPTEADKSYYVVKFKQSGVPFNFDKLTPYDGKYRLNFEPDGGPFTLDNLDEAMPTDGTFQMDPNKMTFSDINLYKRMRDAEDIVASLNWEKEFNEQFKLKIGGKYRDKKVISTFSDEYYVLKEGEEAIYMADAGKLIDQPGKEDYMRELNSNYHNIFGKVMDEQSFIDFWENNRSKLRFDNDESATLENGGANGDNYEINETHIAGYAMGTYKPSNQLGIIFGARLVNTDTKVEGYNYLEEEGKSEKSKASNSYLNVLPMAHVKYSPNEDINLKFAVTRTFARPDYGYLVPGGSYMSLDENYRGGNPNLNPTSSWNFDLMGEYYLGRLNYISLGAFYKSIKDPIFLTTYKGDILHYTNIDINAPLNGDAAWLAGIEAGFNYKLDFINGFFSGFGLMANATFMTSEMTIPDRSDKVRIPRQANELYNIALYFERGGFNARLAINHKGDYIMEHGSEPKDDEYYGDYTTLDFNTTFSVAKKMKVFLELNNLLNNPMIYYAGEIGRPLQIEYYGIRGQVGIKYSVF